MIISASIQAANQVNIIKDIHKQESKFDQIHVDITDGHFTDNISMSFQHIKEVKAINNGRNSWIDYQLANLLFGDRKIEVLSLVL